MSTPRASFGHRRTRKTDSSRRTLALGLAMSMLGAGTLALTVPSLASATPSGCADVLAVITPGTWETKSDADPGVPVGMMPPATSPPPQACRFRGGRGLHCAGVHVGWNDGTGLKAGLDDEESALDVELPWAHDVLAPTRKRPHQTF